MLNQFSRTECLLDFESMVVISISGWAASMALMVDCMVSISLALPRPSSRIETVLLTVLLSVPPECCVREG